MMGMVVTASYNSASDNGVKFVELLGGMLLMVFEGVVEMLVNVEDGDVEM